MPTYNTGAINQRMRVTGFGLYALSGIETQGAGFIDFQYYDSTPEYIEFQVPENITYGNINFYFITGQSASDPTFKTGISFYPIPRIDSVFPQTQDVNNFVVVSGKSLSGVDTVWFNNISGTSVSYNNNSGGLVVKVPSGYTTGPIKISGYNNSGIVSQTSTFNYYGKISLTGFSSNIGYEGDVINISGQNFNLSFVNGNVFPVTFGNNSKITGAFSGSNDIISGQIPLNATSGNVYIRSIDGTVFTSTVPLYVLRTPSVSKTLKYYLNSGEGNTIIGKNLNFATGITLSGYNYRQAKPIYNYGVTSSPSGKFGRALFFDSGDYFQIPAPYCQDFSCGAGDFTLEFWINPKPYAAARIDLISNDPMTTQRQSGILLVKEASSSNWDFKINNTTIISIPTVRILANEWSKIAISKKAGTTIAISTGGTSPFSTTVATAYTIASTGQFNVGSSTSGVFNNFSGLIDDFRFCSTGLYDATTLPQISVPLFDIPSTKLLIHGNFTDLDFSGNRNAINRINEVSGSIEDYNYAAYLNLNQFNASNLTINSLGNYITFTGTGVLPGFYNLVIYNTGGKAFAFPQIQVVKSQPIIKNIDYNEGYIGQQINIIGQNLYPGTQIYFQDTGSGGAVESSEIMSSYNFRSTYRQQKSFFSNAVGVTRSGYKFDDRSFGFTGSGNAYIIANVSSGILSTGKSFTVDIDFCPNSGFIDGKPKYLLSSNSLNVYVNLTGLIVSGFRYKSNTIGVVTGFFQNPTGWHHLSIHKNYIDSNNVTGDIFLDGSGIISFNSDFSLGTSGLIIGNSTGLLNSTSWSGYIDEIRVCTESKYLNSPFPPINRFRNDSSTDLLIHANFDLYDDNILDFGHVQTSVPNLSNIRKSYIIADNGSGQFTGLYVNKFTFLSPPQITGYNPKTGIQGQTWTGLGSDLYYVKYITLGNSQVTGFTINNSGSEFKQSITFLIPDNATNQDYLNFYSDYYSYTYPSGIKISSGSISINGFSPTSGVAGDIITASGKFLNRVKAVRFGGQVSSHYYDITSFISQAIDKLVFQLPNAYDLADGPLTFLGNNNEYVSSSQTFTYLNPSILLVSPTSAYLGDTIIFSGTNLSGYDFYASGANKDVVQFPVVSRTNNTGVKVTVPREIVRSKILFYYSGTNSGAAGNSKFFEPSITISGVDATGYRSRNPILITGINAFNNTAKDLYISGYNLLTNRTGQYLIAPRMTLFKGDSVTGAGISQPYTGYSILSGNLVLYSSLDPISNFSSSYLSISPVGMGTSLAGFGSVGVGSSTSGYDTNVAVDGFIGSGKLLFQRNSFNPDNLYQTITIFAPQIGISGMNYFSGNTMTLLTISGSNLNYVTGIRFTGISRLSLGATGGSNAPVEVRFGYNTGINMHFPVTGIGGNLYYKDSNFLQFYPPSMLGYAIHNRDVCDVRPITGKFYLLTYMGEEYQVPGQNFNYVPYISVSDAFLNNGIPDPPYVSDNTSQVSGYDGSIISFSGEGVRFLTDVSWFSISGELDSVPDTFKNKKQAIVAFYNQAGNQVTGYSILDPGAGYTTSSVAVSFDSSAGIGNTVPIANALVSFVPPYVGMVTGIFISQIASGKIANAWSGTGYNSGSGAATISTPTFPFISRAPAALQFTGTNFSTQSGAGFYYDAFYTTSTVFPTGNPFVVGEVINFKLKNRANIYTTTANPFLVIQDPRNVHKVADVNLTGSLVGQKDKVGFNYANIFGTPKGFFGNLFNNEPIIKAAIMYPSGYGGPLIIAHLDSTSIALTGFSVNFSTAIPATGSYVNQNNPDSVKFLRLRVEASDPNNSFYKNIGMTQLQSKNIPGTVSIGTSAGYGSAGYGST